MAVHASAGLEGYNVWLASWSCCRTNTAWFGRRAADVITEDLAFQENLPAGNLILQQ